MLVSLTAFIWRYFGTGRKWFTLAIPFIYAIELRRSRSALASGTVGKWHLKEF